MISYEQARKDHEYLWSLGEAWDMTGGYTDSEDLARMLITPTKSTARRCYCSQIIYWFEVGYDTSFDERTNPAEIMSSDPIVAEIAKRHGCL